MQFFLFSPASYVLGSCFSWTYPASLSFFADSFYDSAGASAALSFDFAFDSLPAFPSVSPVDGKPTRCTCLCVGFGVLLFVALFLTAHRLTQHGRPRRVEDDRMARVERRC